MQVTPFDYAGRLIPMFPNAPWKRLKRFALDATDLALSKLERNHERSSEVMSNADPGLAARPARAHVCSEISADAFSLHFVH